MNVPSPNLDNADSPPGPLQNNLKDTELTDWRTIDWTAVVATAPMEEADVANEGVSWTTATATGFDAFDGVLTDFERGYGGFGLLCLLPCPIALVITSDSSANIANDHCSRVIISSWIIPAEW